MAPSFIEMALSDVLNEGAGKSEVRASQAEDIAQIGDFIVESIPDIIPGQEISSSQFGDLSGRLGRRCRPGAGGDWGWGGLRAGGASAS